jgi:hypothetical protein
LILHVIEVEGRHIASGVLQNWDFNTIRLFLSDFLLELQHFGLRLISNPQQLVLDVLAGGDVLHLEKGVDSALRLGTEGKRD